MDVRSFFRAIAAAGGPMAARPRVATVLACRALRAGCTEIWRGRITAPPRACNRT
ncbi:hypothetical protein [Methylobacterium indicum]|uniref:hypothetical protein n=1 Tax=Methylobacterium indicum TaxID=1775910 RepID=UPI000B1C6C39|nr:hypothetical protein [Methylobacterium indicum]